MSLKWLAGRAFNEYSQFGEDGVLEAIFEVIGQSNCWCLECGAADGLFFSNTRRLIERDCWSAILIEGDKKAFSTLQENCAEFADQAHCVHEIVNNDFRLEPILSRYHAPQDIDLVVIDVDGQDYYLFNSLLRYRPRVVVIEFDPNVDLDFIPALGGPGQAGRGAIERLLMGRIYAPVYRSFCNIIAVAHPLQHLLNRGDHESPVDPPMGPVFEGPDFPADAGGAGSDSR